MIATQSESTRVRSVRLPARTWDLLAKASAKEYRSINEQILKLVEDFLVDQGFMAERDRKPPIRRKKAKEV